MIRSILALALVAAAAATAAPVSAQQVAQTTEKAKHGAWAIRCATQQPDNCVMSQQGMNDKGEPVLLVNFRRVKDLKDKEGKPVPAIMSVAAPIGVYLPAGLVAQIDGNPAGATGFKYCEPSACIIEEPVSDKFVTNMKKGSNVVMSIRGLNGSRADIKLSLKGFTKAFNSL